MPPWLSPLFSIFLHKPLKRIFAQNINIINTICMYRSNSINLPKSYLKCPLKFFFLAFFSETIQLNLLNFFCAIAIFDLIR